MGLPLVMWDEEGVYFYNITRMEPEFEWPGAGGHTKTTSKCTSRGPRDWPLTSHINWILAKLGLHRVMKNKLCMF